MPQLYEMDCTRPKKEDQLTSDQLAAYLEQVPDWEIVIREATPRLERAYKFSNFAAALDFTNKVGALAEAQDHHPAILTEWGKVTVTYWTHFTGGLHQNDFIMAARTDRL